MKKPTKISEIQASFIDVESYFTKDHPNHPDNWYAARHIINAELVPALLGIPEDAMDLMFNGDNYELRFFWSTTWDGEMPYFLLSDLAEYWFKLTPRQRAYLRNYGKKKAA
ncbi:MAG: hypothetical protein U1E28_06360 [Beijerinckiaceae bacterium]